MWKRKELKEKAKLALKRNYWKAVLVTAVFMSLFSAGRAATSAVKRGEESGEYTGWVLVIIAIVGAVAAVASLLAFAFIISPLEVGVTQFRLKALRGTGNISDMGHGYDVSYKRNVCTLLCRSIYIALWLLLFVIPGIIKIYEYRMIPFLLADNPEMTRKEAFAASKAMMKGNKWRAFVLDLSFILWYLLSGLTFGILAVLYVDPYVQLTEAALYEELKKN